jgi:hypothetical protein
MIDVSLRTHRNCGALADWKTEYRCSSALGDRLNPEGARSLFTGRSDIMPVGDSKRPNAKSPAIIAGLRRIATSLWLHFVASPQRVPVFSHRRRGRPVVNVIYRASPPIVEHFSLGEISWLRTSGSIRLRNTLPVKPDRATDVVSTSTDPPITVLGYAEPERVSSLQKFARTHPQLGGWRGWCQVSFFELTPQLVRDLDFRIGSEPNRRVTVGIMVVQFNLEHDETPSTARNGPTGLPQPTCISRASN